MTGITTAQKIRYTFDAKDGFGNPVNFDEVNTPPVAAVSDETKAQVLEQPAKGEDGLWGATFRAIAPGDVEVSIAVDVDVSEGSSLFLGRDTLTITEDERFGQRVITMTPSTPVDA